MLSADTEREQREARDAAEAAADVARERTRIEALNEAGLRAELARREVALPAGAPREALVAAHLAAPPPTGAQLRRAGT
jgi:hypothetical protein